MLKSGILVAAVMLFCGFPAVAAVLSDLAIDEAMTQMERQDERGYAAVLGNSDGAPAYLLLMAAKYALTQGDIEDAAFLFYSGLLRYKIDLASFPMVDNDPQPQLLMTVASDELAVKIVPELIELPAVYATVLERLRKWVPETAAGYAPGWSFRARLAREEVPPVVDREKESLVTTLHNLEVMLRDPKYLGNLREVLRRAIGAGAGDADSAKAMEEAEEELSQMERLGGTPALYSPNGRRKK